MGKELVPGFIDPINAVFGEIASDEEHLEVFKNILKMDFKPPSFGRPRGIITVGGGKYWPGIVVSIKMLRESGCNLPVQIWYNSNKERINPLDLIEDKNVEIIDCYKTSKRLGDSRIINGWEAKHYALTHTDFEKVIFLDADAYFVNDPEPLFAKLEQERVGMLFWEDLPNKENIKWDRVYPHEKGVVQRVQGGQLVIDRKLLWKEIVVSHWLNQHSDYYYRLMYGDQDTWRVVFSILNSKVLNLGRAEWKKIAFVCSTDSVNYVVHRCQSKLLRKTEVKHNLELPKERIVFDLFHKFLKKEESSDIPKIFDGVYANQIWGDSSGAGSSDKEGEYYIYFINSFIKENKIESVIDCGCGDGNLGTKIIVKEYVGLDCSNFILDKTKRKFPDKDWRFLEIYKDAEKIPAGDLLLAKDVLHHWNNDMVIDWIKKIKEMNKWRYVILTNDCEFAEDNKDCEIGNYRALDHEKFPLKHFGLELLSRYLHKSILQLS